MLGVGAVYVLAVVAGVAVFEFGPADRASGALWTLVGHSTFPAGFALLGVYPALLVGMLLQGLTGLSESNPLVLGPVVATTLFGAAAGAAVDALVIYGVLRLIHRACRRFGRISPPA